MSGRLVVLDTETTGIGVHDGHRILEVGCVEVIDFEITGKEYHTLVDPERPIPAQVVAIHGIDNAKVRGKPKFNQIAGSLMGFIGDANVVAHNARFDVTFINAQLEMIGSKCSIKSDSVIDTLSIAKAKFPGAQASLNALCRRFGVSLDARSKHGALIDAKLLAEVYIRMEDGAQKFFRFSDERSSGNDAPVAVSQRCSGIGKGFINEVIAAASTVNPSEEETLVHEKFLESVSNPIWKRST